MNKDRAALPVLLSLLLAACGGGNDVGVKDAGMLTPMTAATPVGDGGSLSLMSRDAAGLPATAPFAAMTSLTPDLIVFASAQDGLTGDDFNGMADVFMRRRSDGQTWKLSLADGTGVAADGPSGIVPELPGLTNLSVRTVDAAGDEIAFVTDATNLAGADTNGVPDVYLRFPGTDTRPAHTWRVSQTATGGEPAAASFSPAIISPGKVAFVTASPLLAADFNGTYDVYLKDVATGNLSLISRPGPGLNGNGPSFDPQSCIQGGVAGICYLSWADNLIPGDTNHALDLFFHNPVDGAVTRVSATATGSEADRGLLGPAHVGQISFAGGSLYDAGSFNIAFLSESANLTPGDSNNRLDAFIKDGFDATLDRVSVNAAGVGGATLNGIAALPYAVAFASDQPLTGSRTPGSVDIYVRNYFNTPFQAHGAPYLYRVSNTLTDTWPVSAVAHVQGFVADPDERFADLLFSGSAQPSPGVFVDGVFAAKVLY